MSVCVRFTETIIEEKMDVRDPLGEQLFESRAILQSQSHVIEKNLARDASNILLDGGSCKTPDS